MPGDAHPPEDLFPPQVVTFDDEGRLVTGLHCHDCGYNLRTRHHDETCPECGASLAYTVRHIREQRALTHRRRQGLKGFAKFVALSLLIVVVIHLLISFRVRTITEMSAESFRIRRSSYVVWAPFDWEIQLTKPDYSPPQPTAVQELLVAQKLIEEISDETEWTLCASEGSGLVTHFGTFSVFKNLLDEDGHAWNEWTKAHPTEAPIVWRAFVTLVRKHHGHSAYEAVSLLLYMKQSANGEWILEEIDRMLKTPPGRPIY